MFTSEEKLVFPVILGRDAEGNNVQVMVDPLAFWNRLVKALDGDAQGAIDATQTRPGLDANGVPELGPDGVPLAEPETPGERLLRYAAEDRLIAALRAAFGMLDYDAKTGMGATSKHCGDAMNSYFRWLAGERSGGEVSQTGSAATAGQPLVP